MHQADLRNREGGDHVQQGNAHHPENQQGAASSPCGPSWSPSQTRTKPPMAGTISLPEQSADFTRSMCTSAQRGVVLSVPFML